MWAVMINYPPFLYALNLKEFVKPVFDFSRIKLFGYDVQIYCIW
jgi:hypothetical protein